MHKSSATANKTHSFTGPSRHCTLSLASSPPAHIFAQRGHLPEERLCDYTTMASRKGFSLAAPSQHLAPSITNTRLSRVDIDSTAHGLLTSLYHAASSSSPSPPLSLSIPCRKASRRSSPFPSMKQPHPSINEPFAAHAIHLDMSLSPQPSGN